MSGGGGLERSDSSPAADGCTAGDAFDLAAIYWHDHSARAEIAQSPATTDHVVSSALNRLNLAKHQYQADIRSLINASPRGEEIMGRLVGLRWRGCTVIVIPTATRRGCATINRSSLRAESVIRKKWQSCDCQRFIEVECHLPP